MCVIPSLGAGQSALLERPASVRFAGLNGSGAALVGHAATVFTNPAGLATISHVALEGSYQTAVADAYVASAALGWRVRQFDVGFGMQYFDFGADPLGNFPGVGAVDANEVLAVGSLVYRFGLIALGVSGKYVRQELDQVTEEGSTIDMGLAIAVFDIMALGFAVQNIGGNWRSESSLEMPRLSRFGFTMNYVDPQEAFRLLSTLEVQWRRGYETRWVLGGEGGIVVGQIGILGRLGWGTKPTGAPLARWTFGGTVELSRVKLDYAFETDDILDETIQRLGMRFAF